LHQLDYIYYKNIVPNLCNGKENKYRFNDLPQVDYIYYKNIVPTHGKKIV